MGWIEPLVADKLFGGDDGGDSGPDGVARRPLPQNPERRAGEVQNWANLAAAYHRTGRTLPGWVENLLKRNGNPEASIDFNDPNIKMSDWNSLRGKASQASNRMIQPGVWTNKGSQLLGENKTAQNEANWKNEYEPNLDKALGMANDLADTRTISATQEANARANISSTIRGSLENNLRTTAATFGMRNLSPSSPAGAAVAARMSLEADAELARTLDAHGLQVSDINRKDQQASMELLTQLTAKKMAMENAINDPSLMIQLNNDVGALLQAIRTQRESEQFQRDLMREQSKPDYLSMGLNLAGQTAGAVATGGLSLAAQAAAPSGWNSNWGASTNPFFGSTTNGSVSYSGR